MNIITLLEKKPILGSNCFVAPNATIIGDVVIGDNCSIWFNAVIRGDVQYIRIGNFVNIQDGAIIHCTYQKAPVNIGNYVSIAHKAVIHGCTIYDNVLIGIGAIILDNCIIHSNSLIAAGSVLLENTVVEEGSVFAGVPAKKIKNIDPQLLKGQVERIAHNYQLYASWYKTI